MGKTSKPLTFVIEASIDGPTFQALRDQGHDVKVLEEGFGGVYLDNQIIIQPVLGYFGPKCWRMDKRVAEDPKLFEAALKSMREIYDHGVENPKAAKAKTGKAATKPPATRKTRRAVATPVAKGDSRVTEVSGPADDSQTSLLGGHEEGGTP